MSKKIKFITATSIAISFFGLVGTIIFLSANESVSPQMAKLMIIALIGLYIGFGVLIAVYRLVAKLD